MGRWDELLNRPYKIGSILRIRLLIDYELYNSLTGYKYREKEKKMTREEAEKIVLLNAYSPSTDTFFGGDGKRSGQEQFVDVLKALGLIEFEEKPKKSYYDCLIANYGSQNSVDEILKELDRNGYKIVEK